jgi:hypothetical protein
LTESLYFAIEGADIVFTYLNEKNDAEKTKTIIEKIGRQCIMKAGDNVLLKQTFSLFFT